MWRNRGWLAVLLTICLPITTVADAANPQNKRLSQQSFARVVSVTEDQSGNFVLLNTVRGQQLPVPSIHYLPSASGKTVMAIDFFGAVLHSGNSAFSFPHSAVTHVSVGQLQAQPPVLRIALESSTQRAFQHVDIKALPGSLIIKLPSEIGSGQEAKRSWVQPPTVRSQTAINSAPSKISTPPSDTTPPPAPERQAAEPKLAPDISRSAQSSDDIKPRLRGPINMPVTTPIGAPISVAPAPNLEVRDATYKKISEAPKPETKVVKVTTYEKTSAVPRPPTKVLKVTTYEKISEAAKPETKATRDSTSDKVSEASKPQSKGLRGAFKRFFGIDNADNPKPAEEADPTRKTVSEKPAKIVATQMPPKAVTRTASVMPKPAPSFAKKKLPAEVELKNELIDPAAPMKLEIVAGEPFLIRVVSAKATDFRTFRLHEPERYVIDIPKPEGATDIPAPEIAENELIKAIRVGSPSEDATTMRIVLDLASEDVGITERLDASGTAVIVSAQRGVPVARLTRSGFIVLDAGHGGTDPGAQRGDVREKELTLGIVYKLKRELESRGIRVKLTRGDDTYVSLEDRVKITNANQPDAFVSVHINSLETNNSTSGIETYFQNGASQDLAQLIHNSLVKGVQAPDRRVRKARFYVINHTPIPAVLAEVGFISNKEERDKLTSSDYQEKIAQSIADGVVHFVATRPETPMAARDTGLSGTISAMPASAPTQSFTQNLHSKIKPKAPLKLHESSSYSHKTLKIAAEKPKTKIGRQSLKFKKDQLASKRS